MARKVFSNDDAVVPDEDADEILYGPLDVVLQEMMRDSSWRGPGDIILAAGVTMSDWKYAKVEMRRRGLMERRELPRPGHLAIQQVRLTLEGMAAAVERMRLRHEASVAAIEYLRGKKL
jgi:hypothetical protein